MTEPKHTPGPWKIIDDAQGPNMILSPHHKDDKGRRKCIACLTETFSPTAGYIYDYPYNERTANARLIAKAPEYHAAILTISKLMGNQPLDEIEQCDGINDGRLKAGQLRSAIEIAKSVLKEGKT